MARIRSVKPEFWTDALMVQLPHLARLLFIGLWTASDDHGYLRDEPQRVAMELLPKEDENTVAALLGLLIACGRIERFEDPDGGTYLRITNWERHQRVDHPAVSRIYRKGSRKLAIPLAARRAVAEKYGCPPGGIKAAVCYFCGLDGRIYWHKLVSGRPSGWVSFVNLELDHLDPQVSEGANSVENLVLACRACNRSKGTATAGQFLESRVFANGRETSRGLLVGKEGKGKEGKGKEPLVLSDEFDVAWKLYPKRPNNSRMKALKAWSARIREGEDPELMVVGVRNYAAYLTRSDTPARFIKLGATFFGPDRPYTDDYGSGDEMVRIAHPDGTPTRALLDAFGAPVAM